MMSRRAALAGGLALGACGPVTLVADAGHRPEGSEWAQFPLADFPELAARGGTALLVRPEALINVWVLHREDDTFTAVWRVCTHGACDVEPRAGEYFCPCHGSIFSSDGAVLRGPATRPLARFDAVRFEDSLFLRRRS